MVLYGDINNDYINMNNQFYKALRGTIQKQQTITRDSVNGCILMNPSGNYMNVRKGKC